MYKSNVEEFANYQVYEYIKNKVHVICICQKSEVAHYIAQMLAFLDKDYDPYYVTGIYNQYDLIPGGGYYDRYQKDKETGKVKHSSLG